MQVGFDVKAGEDHSVVLLDHDHHFIKYFKSYAIGTQMWLVSKIINDVDGAHQVYNLYLEVRVVMQQEWQPHIDNSFQQESWIKEQRKRVPCFV